MHFFLPEWPHPGADRWLVYTEYLILWILLLFFVASIVYKLQYLYNVHIQNKHSLSEVVLHKQSSIHSLLLHLEKTANPHTYNSLEELLNIYHIPLEDQKRIISYIHQGQGDETLINDILQTAISKRKTL